MKPRKTFKRVAIIQGRMQKMLKHYGVRPIELTTKSENWQAPKCQRWRAVIKERKKEEARNRE